MGQVNNGGFLKLFGNFGEPVRQWRYTSASDADARQIQATYWLTFVQRARQRKGTSALFWKSGKNGWLSKVYFLWQIFQTYRSARQRKSRHRIWQLPLSFILVCLMGGDINGTGAGESEAPIAIRATKIRWPPTHWQRNPFSLQNPKTLKRMGAKSWPSDWTVFVPSKCRRCHSRRCNQQLVRCVRQISWRHKHILRYGLWSASCLQWSTEQQMVWISGMVNGKDYGILLSYRRQPVKELCKKWVSWAIENTRLKSDGTYEIPSTLEWSGQPDPWTGKPSENKNLHCTVTEWTVDVE